MFNLGVYREVKSWKKPVHLTRQLAAKSYLKTLSGVDVIGITGSVGKTLTQNAIASVLSQKFKVVVGEENLDPTFRIPKTILNLKPWDQKIILEYGVEHPGDMDHYLTVAQPKIAVVTAITPTHTKYFKDIEGVYAEKSKLIKSLPKDGEAILNADDKLVAQMANLTKAKINWFGKNSKDGVKISHFTQNLKGSKFRLHYKGQKASVSWKIVGEHQLTSAYAAAAVGISSGLTIKQIAKGLTLLKPPLHRLNVITRKDFTILDDTYNASPKAMAEALKTLAVLGRGQKKFAVLGEMKDLGVSSDDEHQKIGELVTKSKINFLVTLGKTAGIIAKSAKKNKFKGKIFEVKSTGDATSNLKKNAIKNSVILIKGSRHAHLERIVNALLGKSTQINCYHCGKLEYEKVS